MLSLLITIVIYGFAIAAGAGIMLLALLGLLVILTYRA